MPRRHPSYEELYRAYLSRVEAIPSLKPGEDLTLARLWRDHKDEQSRNRLVEAHLRIVPGYARQTAVRYLNSPYDWGVIRQLIGAGNDGLILAVDRFDPSRGFQFSTASRWSIRKEIIREALLYLKSVSRPYDVKLPRDVSLDCIRGEDDRELEITIGRIPRRRLLCIEPGDEGDTPQDSCFSRALSDGYATLQNPGEATGEATHAAIEEGEILSGRLDDLHLLLVAKADQILDPRDREIYRARYLFPARMIKLKKLADRYGVSEARVSQIAAEADRNVRAAIASDSLADRYREIRFPTWRTIDEWCEHSKEAQRKSIEEWRDSGDRNINRVRTALDAGVTPENIGKQLEIPTTTAGDPTFNPAAHLVKLAEWRRVAEEQDRERERLEKYLEHKSLEQRITLTTRGYRTAWELDREAEDGTQTSSGKHSSALKRTRSVA